MNETWFDNVVTMYESWMHCYNPTLKQQMSTWVEKRLWTSIKTTNYEIGRKRSRRSLFFFFNQWECCPPISSQSDKLWMQTISWKSWSIWNKCTFWKKHSEFKNSAWKLHMEQCSIACCKYSQASFRTLEHWGNCTPYSPDLPPKNFFLYLTIKKTLKGENFGSVEALKAAVQAKLQDTAKYGSASMLNNGSIEGTSETW